MTREMKELLVKAVIEVLVDGIIRPVFRFAYGLAFVWAAAHVVVRVVKESFF